ncbi:hypothetical protein KCP74_01940 [Salmonella enterica subsp. enterica]|nr:hypothetical protein KCP74_01940 [Salmonella enterica subsp. enterica]
MRFFGSAMYFPHVDGGFTDLKLSIPFSAFWPERADEKSHDAAEPLAVAIHAAHEAGVCKDGASLSPALALSAYKLLAR